MHCVTFKHPHHFTVAEKYEPSRSNQQLQPRYKHSTHHAEPLDEPQQRPCRLESDPFSPAQLPPRRPALRRRASVEHGRAPAPNRAEDAHLRRLWPPRRQPHRINASTAAAASSPSPGTRTARPPGEVGLVLPHEPTLLVLGGGPGVAWVLGLPRLRRAVRLAVRLVHVCVPRGEQQEIQKVP